MRNSSPFVRTSLPREPAPDTYAAFVTAAERATRRQARVTFGQRGEGFDWLELGRYMDEVNNQALNFDTWVNETWAHPKGDDHLSQGFFSTWNTWMNATPYTTDSRGRPFGWRAYYRTYRGLLVPDVVWNWLADDVPLWEHTEAFEDELIELYDWAIAEGGNPPLKRPTPKYQPPPPEKTIEGKVEGALKWVGIIGLVAAVGYVLNGLPLKGGGSS